MRTAIDVGGAIGSEADSTRSAVLAEALSLPNGARFYRCALQVNPFAYLQRHNKPTGFTSESEYNDAIVNGCLQRGIEVIAVTDHWEFEQSSSQSLLRAARNAGIFSFGGFEAKSSEGVHVLCLFDPQHDGKLTSYRGECGVHDPASPPSTKTCDELIKCMQSHGGICVAAHVLRPEGGFLKVLKGQTRVHAWTSGQLLAAAIAGPIENAGNDRAILANEDPQYKRVPPVAIINANDVTAPKDLEDRNVTCLIKMSGPSVEALRQAFLDPSSRVRLNTDPEPPPHAELVALAWEGGFLDGVRLHFNADLNVFVGGRGTGKSTVIESIRYVLGIEPVGEDARKAHDGIVRHVLKPGTKISLLVRSHRPIERHYTVERTVPNPSVVKDHAGEIVPVTPPDVTVGIQAYGQHEIAELTKNKEKLTLLLERFAKRSPSTVARKARLVLDLEKSRGRIAEVRRELDHVRERLAVLPSLEETLKRYQQAGLEDRLKEKSLLVREERVFKIAGERLQPLKQLHSELIYSASIDAAFVSEKSVDGLPNAALLLDLGAIITTLSRQASKIAEDLGKSIGTAEQQIGSLSTKWDERRTSVDESYQKLLRELQKSKIDGDEFIRLRRTIEELRPLNERKEALQRDLKAHHAQRRKVLDEWEDIKAEEFRSLDKAARFVNGKLQNRVQVVVRMAGSIDPLEKLLRDELPGNLTAMLTRLRESDRSLITLAAACREGVPALVERYRFTQAMAERLVQAGPDIGMKIEELDLPSTTDVELNTAPEGSPPTWQALDDLSKGQKATAVLLLLLLESDTHAPLIVDQPEDDLDNRFISDGVVPTMRDEKTRRQFLLSTHNANIPVLGDAELIVGLGTTARDGTVYGRADASQMGSIDTASVRELVEDVLEGGKAAFEMRRLKYGF